MGSKKDTSGSPPGQGAAARTAGDAPAPEANGDIALAAGVLLYRRGEDGAPRFLLLEAVKGGHWSPPKGHLEDGEGFQDAALRETREECGLAPASLDPAFREEIGYIVTTKKGRVRPKRVVYFLGEAAPGALRLSDEHTGARWETIEGVRACVTFPTLLAVFERAARRLSESAS